MIYLLSGLLCLSLILNSILIFMYFKKPPVKVEYTEDAGALLRDLARGPALLKVQYVDSADVLIRSPRHFR